MFYKLYQTLILLMDNIHLLMATSKLQAKWHPQTKHQEYSVSTLDRETAYFRARFRSYGNVTYIKRSRASHLENFKLNKICQLIRIFKPAFWLAGSTVRTR